MRILRRICVGRSSLGALTLALLSVEGGIVIRIALRLALLGGVHCLKIRIALEVRMALEDSRCFEHSH